MATVLSLVVNDLKDLTISLTGRTVTDPIAKTIIKLAVSAHGTGAFTDVLDAAYTLTPDGTTPAAKAVLAFTTAFNNDDVLRMRIEDSPTDVSNRVLSDLSSTFTSGLGAVIYEPTTNGNYTISNKLVNDEPFALPDILFTASTKPVLADSTMEFAKGYLVKFVGTKYNLNVLLKTGSGATDFVDDGLYEFVYAETKR